MSAEQPSSGWRFRRARALETLRAGFFWRTFLLFAGLVIASVIAIFASYRLLDPAPPEQRLAWEIASIVNLTRSALLGSAPARRLPLLEQLADEEGLRVLPLEPGDRVQPPAPQSSLRALEARLQQLLDEDTRVAGRVNDEDGLWVSFTLSGDAYWMVLPIERLERQFGPGLSTILWVTGLLSLVGAFILSWQADRPLAAIAVALNRLGRGEPVSPLPEEGPPRLAAVRRNFNWMSAELAAIDEDRSVALAGISHDLRSPLTRLRLEIEMARLSDGERQAMIDDIERIDAIVGQFVEYARLGTPARRVEVDAAAELRTLVERYRNPAGTGPAPALLAELPAVLRWLGDPVDLRRVTSNLVDNAIRHGAGPDGRSTIKVALEKTSRGIRIVVEDEGMGILPALYASALRPFSRLDAARTDSGTRGGGSGLGLAIVARIARRYTGEVRLASGERGGLRVSVDLPEIR